MRGSRLVTWCALTFAWACTEAASTPPPPATAEQVQALVEFDVPGVGNEWEFGSLRIAVEVSQKGQTTLIPASAFDKNAAFTSEKKAGFRVLAATPDLSVDGITATLEMITAPLEPATATQMEALTAVKDFANVANTALPGDVPWATYKTRIKDQVISPYAPKGTDGIRDSRIRPYQKVSYLSDVVDAYNALAPARFQMRLQDLGHGNRYVLLVRSLKDATKNSSTQVNFGLRVDAYAAGMLSDLSGFKTDTDTNYLYSRLTESDGCSVADGFTAHAYDPQTPTAYSTSNVLKLLGSNMVQGMFVDMALTAYTFAVAKANSTLSGHHLKNKLQYMPKVSPAQMYSPLAQGAGSVGAAVDAIPNLQDLTCRYLDHLVTDRTGMNAATDVGDMDNFTYARCMASPMGVTSTADYISKLHAVTSTNVPVFNIGGHPAIVIEERSGTLRRGFLVHGKKRRSGLTTWSLGDQEAEVEDALKQICQIGMQTWRNGKCQ